MDDGFVTGLVVGRLDGFQVGRRVGFTVRIDDGFILFVGFSVVGIGVGLNGFVKATLPVTVLDKQLIFVTLIRSVGSSVIIDASSFRIKDSWYCRITVLVQFFGSTDDGHAEHMEPLSCPFVLLVADIVKVT